MGAEDGKKELINHTASSGNLPNPGLKPASPALQADSLPTAPSGKPSPPSSPYSNVTFSGDTRSKNHGSVPTPHI